MHVCMQQAHENMTGVLLRFVIQELSMNLDNQLTKFETIMNGLNVHKTFEDNVFFIQLVALICWTGIYFSNKP